MTDKTARVLLPALLALVVLINAWTFTSLHTPRTYGHDALTRGVNALATLHIEGPSGLVHFFRAQGLVVDFQWTHLVGAALLAGSGNSWRAMVMAPTLFLLLLLTALFFIGAKLHSKAAGLAVLAAALVCPGIVGWSRYYASLTANMALVALAVCLLLYSEHGRRWVWAAAAGAVTALAVKSGEAVGEAFLNGLTILPVAALLLAPALRSGRRRGLVGAACFVAALALLLDWPWLTHMTPYLWREAGGGLANALPTQTVAAPWAAYAIAFFTHNVFFEIAVIALAGTIWFTRRPDVSRYAIVAWWLVPLVALSFLDKKNFLYLATLTPALPILAGVALVEGLEHLAAPRRRRLALVAWIAACSALFILNALWPSWGHQRIERGRTRYAGAFQLDVPNLVPEPPPAADDQTEALVEAALACNPQSVLLLGDTARPVDRMLGAPEQVVRFLFFLPLDGPPLIDLFFAVGHAHDPNGVEAALAAAWEPAPDAFVLLDDFADAHEDVFRAKVSRGLLDAIQGTLPRLPVTLPRQAIDPVAAQITDRLPPGSFDPAVGRRFRLPFPSEPGVPFTTARLVCADVGAEVTP
ncbi:MAG: hypothetical protein P9L99_14615 [Candidatus Lernaella stagnicola]|nr:hypothetical protein [Candidatus Lernaella stagnicola]